MLRIRMLPAADGDCLILEYGETDTPASVNRVLIDAGRGYAPLRRYLRALAPEQRRFELLVITHVDADHIGGVLGLLQDTSPSTSATFGDIWFNGYRQLEQASDRLGAVQGEEVTQLLQQRPGGFNRTFGGGPVMLSRDGSLPVHTLPGGLQLTVLSPRAEELQELVPRWKEECARAGIVPGAGAAPRRRKPPGGDDRLGTEDLDPDAVRRLAAARSAPDDGEPNGSSIAFLAEFGGQSCLLTGDAYAPTLVESLQKLASDRGLAVPQVDAFKLPHHGSQGNVSVELVKAVRSPRYLFSTNGARHHHPDRESVARVLVHGGPRPHLYFNYATDYTTPWGRSGRLRDRFRYSTTYPKNKGDVVAVDLG